MEQRILVTGADGFIARNLIVRLQESGYAVVPFRRGDSPELFRDLLSHVDAVIHLAGENRPSNTDFFELNNADLTRQLCDAVIASGRSIPIFFSSSTQAALDNPYGRSKLRAEEYLRALARKTGCAVSLARLPGVFGKWCKPHYNSVVATFCYQIARNLPIDIRDRDAIISLVYVDDVIDAIIGFLASTPRGGVVESSIGPMFRLTLGELADHLRSFQSCRDSLLIARVGTGLVRALYATYISYLPMERFAYAVPKHGDARGVFVEMLKTPDCGQFSFFTMSPGATRGSHYHHSKTEKFLVVRGAAKMRFRNLLSSEYFEIQLSDSDPMVVDTIPGWIHDIINTHDGETVVMLWANEIFDRSRPDTIAGKVV